MRIYFSGIGGVGIGPLAMLALDAGHFVVGTDIQESDMTRELKARGALVQIVKDASFMTDQQANAPIDWYVYSSALPNDHPEILFAKENAIKTSKRAEFLNYLLKEKDLKLIAVAGTHGKTTTTGMLIWLFKQLGLPISYSIGTTITFGQSAQYQESSEYFVYECDEFDRNFLEFNPEISLITSLDYDHADTYPSEKDYLEAFNRFVSQSEQVITWDLVAKKLDGSANVTALTSNADFSEIVLAGIHTRQNAWLAATAVHNLFLDKPLEKLAEILSAFPGTNRRFEKLADNLYTDYAHHPTEIKATLQMALELNKNVVVVYQPHQNIRQHELLQEGGYKDCFDGAKKVYWLPTYLSREYQDLPVLQPDEIVKSTGSEDKIEVAKLDKSLAQSIQSHQQSGDLVVAMSAGDLDTWFREKI